MKCAFVPGILLFGVVSSSASGALLGIDLADTPDIFASNLDVTFDASSDALLVTGFAKTFDDDGVGQAEFINNGTYTLMASIDDAGNATGGSLEITGDVLGNSGTLLTGDLVAFGFDDTSPNGQNMLLDFVFVVTGGELANAFYGGVGNQFGVIMDVDDDGFSGDWTLDFDNIPGGPGTGAGVSDNALLVPVPGVMAGMMLWGLAGRRRRES